MAMKKCRECGHKVSSSAKTCPSCGVKDPYVSPFKGIIFLTVIGVVTWSVFFKDKSHENEKVSSKPVSETGLQLAAPTNLAPAETLPLSPSQVCKAAIAALFSRDINTLKVAKGKSDGVFKISYRAPSDGSQHSYDCKLSGNNVIWTESGQMTNRWIGSGRVDYNVEYALKENVLVITELYGNSNDIVHKFSMNNNR